MKKARLLIVALALLAACEVDSCFYGVQLGIHFHSSDVDFGAPPPRFTVPSGLDEGIEDPWRAGSMRQSDLYGDSDDEVQARQRHLQELWAKSFTLEQQGKYSEAVAVYQELNQKGAGMAAFFVRREQLLSTAPHDAALKQYLAATHPNSKDTALPALETAPAYLKPYIAYEEASRLLDAKKPTEAAKAYEKCAYAYMQSPLVDSAFIMAARVHLEIEQPPKTERGADEASKVADLYSGGRFADSARGLFARSEFLEQHYVAAETLYEKLAFKAKARHDRYVAWESVIDCGRAMHLGDWIGVGFVGLYANAGDNNQALYAVGHLTTALGAMNKDEAAKFRQYLLAHPDLLASYLQLRLEMTATKKEDREGLVALAEQAPTLAPMTLARMAQACFADDDLVKASEFAQRAISSARDQDEAWQIGHYMLGSVKSRKADWPGAIAEYQQVAKAGDDNYLASGAHEASALCYDRSGQEAKALDEYYWLRSWCAKNKQEWNPFMQDIAYMLDAKMSPAEIRQYIDSHPHSDQKNLLRYSLGLRLLRMDQYSAAEKAFSSIPADVRTGFYKQGVEFEEGPIQDPLITARELAGLHHAVSAAPESAKAKALYALASYYYDKRDLLFYNSPLWAGQRSIGIGASWYSATDSAADEAALKTHHLEHECLQRAYDVCMEILHRYPHSAQAPLAAYRAATASERLSHFNPYWRWRAARDRMIDNTIALMQTVAEKYPTSSVAKDARKYAKVYADEKKQLEANDMWKNVPKWFQPGY